MPADQFPSQSGPLTQFSRAIFRTRVTLFPSGMLKPELFDQGIVAQRPFSKWNGENAGEGFVLLRFIFL